MFAIARAAQLPVPAIGMREPAGLQRLERRADLVSVTRESPIATAMACGVF
jgi:hypothetical protein